MDWYVDHGLAVLVGQLKKKYPGIIIGTIGDQAHQNRDSDHNPEADGSVDAADPMLGPHFSRAQCNTVMKALAASRDQRIAYLIWEKRICSSVPHGQYDAWEWRPYNGSDPHTGHGHVSVNDKHSNDTRPWSIGDMNYKIVEIGGYGFPELHYGDDDAKYGGYNGVGRAQSLLNYVFGAGLDVDGRYGPNTQKAVVRLVGGDGKTINTAVWVRLCGMTKVGK